MTGQPQQRHRVDVVLFDGFEVLDVFGPLEVFGVARDHFTISVVGPSAGPVQSAQGPAVMADTAYTDAPAPDIVLVPGGIGTRKLVEDGSVMRWLAGWA